MEISDPENEIVIYVAFMKVLDIVSYHIFMVTLRNCGITKCVLGLYVDYH